MLTCDRCLSGRIDRCVGRGCARYDREGHPALKRRRAKPPTLPVSRPRPIRAPRPPKKPVGPPRHRTGPGGVTPETVALLAADLQSGRWTKRELAVRYRVTYEQVRTVQRGLPAGSVPPPVTSTARGGRPRGPTGVDPVTLGAICVDLLAGRPATTVAADRGVTYEQVRTVRRLLASYPLNPDPDEEFS